MKSKFECNICFFHLADEMICSMSEGWDYTQIVQDRVRYVANISSHNTSIIKYFW